jgi:hypothetical protein
VAYIEYLAFVDLALAEAAKQFAATTPKVVGLYRKLGTDADGRDAVMIWVLLANDTPREQLVPERFKPIADAIHEAVWKKLDERGLDLRPYVYFRLQSEHERLAKTA